MGIVYKTFSSTNTGNTVADCITKYHEIMDSLMAYLVGDGVNEGIIKGYTGKKILKNSVITPNIYDYEIGETDSDGNFINGVLRFYLEVSATSSSISTPFRVFYGFKSYKTNSVVSGSFINTQSSTTSSGVGALKISYIKGINNEICLSFTDYSSSNSLKHGMFKILNIKTPMSETVENAIFFYSSGSTYTFLSNTNSNYFSLKSCKLPQSYSKLNVTSGYDILTPLIVDGTEYMFENLYGFTNSLGVSDTIVTDGTNKYVVLGDNSYGYTALKIE